MFRYSGTATNDEDWFETFQITTPGTDITPWTIDAVVGCEPATVTKDGTNRFTVSVPLATMERFRPGSYPVGVRYTQDGKTVQILVGSLSVAEGGFTP